MNLWEEVGKAAIGYGVAAGLAMMIVVSLAWRRPHRWLPLPRLRVGTWNGPFVAAIFVLSQVVWSLSFGFFHSLGFFDRVLPPDASFARKLNLAAPLAMLLFIALTLTLLHLGPGVHPRSTGLTRARWRANTLLGVVAFLAGAPFVLTVHAISLSFVTPQSHMLQELAKEPLEWYEWGLLFIQAVIFPPIVEEWFFRGLLQGWLRRTTLLGHAILVWLTMGLLLLTSFSIGGHAADAKPGLYGRFFLGLGLCTIYALGIVLVYRPVLGGRIDAFRDRTAETMPLAKVDPWFFDFFAAQGEERRVPPWESFGPRWWKWKQDCARWSIVGSSLVFALAHTSWPDPIPLFLLGLLLGWLAFRTQSLVPSIVLHGLFNLVAFVSLAIR